MGKKVELDVVRLFRMWGDGVPHHRICDELGIAPGTFWEVRRRYALPARKAAASDSGGDKNPPSEEEIAALCAVIRESWSEEERERRLVYRPDAVRTRQYTFNRCTYAFSSMD